MTPEQELHLKGFTEQRDSLMKEVSILVAEKDSLLKENKNLSELNSNLHTQIESLKIESAKIAEDNKIDEEVSKATRVLVQENLDTLTNIRDKSIAEVGVISEKIAEAGDRIEDTLMSVVTFDNWLNETKSKVSEVAENILSVGREVTATVEAIELANKRFTENLVSQETALQERKNTLDIRENMLSDRENEINNTYQRLLNDLKEKGIKLVNSPEEVPEGAKQL